MTTNDVTIGPGTLIVVSASLWYTVYLVLNVPEKNSPYSNSVLCVTMRWRVCDPLIREIIGADTTGPRYTILQLGWFQPDSRVRARVISWLPT